MERVCQRLGIRGGSGLVEAALEERRRIHGAAFARISSDAETTLRRLRTGGVRIGLVSNCTADVSDMLAGSALGGLFDVEIFSATAGMMKPDPRIYLLAAESLGVEPQRCLYVGDGSDHELSGAAAAGMTPGSLRK